jgi:hypothetical protein
MTDTDILERLREEVEYTPVVGATRYRLVSLLGAVEREIERLRAEVDGLHAALAEIEDMIDGEIDINQHGGPNLAMKVQMAIALWKDRYEAERADHEATMKHADKER